MEKKPDDSLEKKMIHTKVSFIVPVYNMEKSLKTCVESILNQTLSNIEIVLIDDGSTDNSGAICDAYASEDRRITVVHKENGGIADAMNIGLDNITGEYILFVDSDDFIDCNMAEIMLRTLLESKADIVQCGYVIHSLDGKVIRNIEGKDSDIQKTDEILETYFLWRGIWGNLSAKLFKTDLFSEIRFPAGRTFADVPVIPYILCQCKKYKIIKNMFYHIMSNPQSASRAKLDEKRFDDIIYNVNVVSNFIIERSPSLKFHVYYLKASTVAYYYEKIAKSNELKDADEKLKKMKAEFKENYRELRRTNMIKKYPFVRRMQLFLFNINPYLSVYMEKFYRIFVAQ